MNEMSTLKPIRFFLPPLLALLWLAVLLSGTQASAAAPAPPVLLRLQAVTFDPLQAPVLPARLAAAVPSPYAVVQFAAPPLPAWRAALETSGVQVLGYLPDYAYLVRLPDGGRAALDGLPGVRWAGALLPAYRLDPALWAASGSLTLTVQLFPGEDPAAVAALDGVQVLETARMAWQTTLRLQADATLLPALAALPGVRWIEAAPAPVLLNDVAAGLSGVTAARETLGLTGAGQVVAVADTGLDLGATGPLTDFSPVVAAYCLGRPAPCLWDDPQGHGTHVAGSVAGSGALSGGQFRGMAPGAGLVVQSLYSPTQPGGLFVPADLNLLLTPPYSDGARIHSDSWGSSGNRYNTWAQTVDQFVWDHPDMLVVVAAGNGGIDRGGDGLVDPGSLYSPATAKNVLTVGASESLRLEQGYTGSYGDSPGGANFPVAPVHSDLISDDPAGLAAFSSRGPAADGRIRPDLVVPGTNIVSARSHHPSAAYPQFYDDDYAFTSGSSQAAPIASGAAALLRQWYVEHGVASPSAALLRATLVNGAVDLTPGQYGPAVGGTVVVSDDVEGTPVWTSTTWVVTGTRGVHSPANAWTVSGAQDIQRLDATLDLSSVTSPTLFFWNRRSFGFSYARVYACGVSPRVSYSPAAAGRVGWALEAVDVSVCAGNPTALLRFEFQCSAFPSCSADFWAVDDLMVADGARLAEVGPPPDVGQGWGRLDLAASLPPRSTLWVTDVLPGLQTGQVLTLPFPLAVPFAPLRATLAWSDYPALPNAALALVNDLDLWLVTPEGQRVYANGLAGPDRTNTVERLAWTPVSSGTMHLVVTGHNVPLGPQPFALVVNQAVWRVYLPLALRASVQQGRPPGRCYCAPQKTSRAAWAR